MSFAKCAFGVLLLIAFAGCTKPAQEAAPQQPPADEQQTTSQSQPQQIAPGNSSAVEAAKPVTHKAPAPKTAPAKSAAPSTEPVAAAPIKAAEPEAPPKPPEPKFATIESGTKIQVRLQDPLDTAVNKTGDTFRTILDQDIVVDGSVVAPRGSVLDGKLSNVARSGRVEGRATMALQLTSLTVNNQTYPLQTDLLSFEAESTKKKDATKVGVGAGIGAVIGAIAGGGKGAAIGAAVGGGAGGAAVVATRGKEVKFEAEQAFSFVLRDSIKVKLR